MAGALVSAWSPYPLDTTRMPPTATLVFDPPVATAGTLRHDEQLVARVLGAVRRHDRGLPVSRRGRTQRAIPSAIVTASRPKGPGYPVSAALAAAP
jgi:hypothetical protein